MDILLAEDDKKFGPIIKIELEEENYRIDLVYDGVEAVLRFIEKPYNFVLLDIKMPNLDGINAMRIMKRLDPSIPMIAFSGNAGVQQAEESRKAGAIQCFTKPFALYDLKECIRRHAL